jgi:ABC-type transport system involved in multi-copper enzyme maturation permease subunit
MFTSFFKKEIFTALRRPMLYIFMFIVGLLVFGAVVSDNVIIGGAVGDVKKNAPSVVAIYVSILSIFGLLFATAFFNNAALRDYKNNFHEILFSTPISKAGYFFGRFAGAWLLSALVITGIYIGFVLGAALGPAFNWMSPDRIGPTPWGAFINTFILFALPNMFLAGSIIFLLATRFRSTTISFVGTLLIIIGYIISLNLTSDIDNQPLAAMIDIFGIQAYSIDIQYYTPAERNTINPAFSRYLLQNRLLWMGVGLVILLFSYFTFSFSTKSSSRGKRKNKKAVQQLPAREPLSPPVLASQGQKQSGWSVFKSFFSINFLSITRSTTFIILLLFSIILLLSNLWGGFEYFGLKSYPVTYKMMDEVNGITSLFVLIILVFFSGELVWRDRDNHINEVIDSTPHQSAVSLFAKTCSLIIVAASLHVFLIFIAILYQVFNGYTKFELGIYFTDFLTEGLMAYVLWAGLFVALQVIINHKYLAYFVSVLLLIMLDLIFVAFKIESNMLNIGSTPSTLYSDMNSFGPGFSGHLWFAFYWLLFGLLTLTLAGLFWPRGMNRRLVDRFRVSKKSLGRNYYGTLGLFSISWIAVAGIVYYNTQILNEYDTSHQQELMQVAYEKQYSQYEGLPHLSITDATYYIDIYPERRATEGKVDLWVTNRSGQPIDSLHFILQESFNQSIDLPGSKVVYEDEDTGYYIYELEQTIQDGDSLQMQCTFSYAEKGFENEVSNLTVLRNGTFFNNAAILPNFGYSADFELSNKNKRRKYELPERQRMPDLQKDCSRLCMSNYLSNGTSDWVNVETYISTSADQIAIAPGSLISKKEEGERHLYHYQVDHPSQNFYSFISARYQVARRVWNGIDLEVYYHPGHEVNVDRMLDAIQKSLEYYTTHFGPYYHRQARIIEFPRYSNFAQAFPGTMPYSESFGFIIDLEGEEKNNVVDAVIAHEMAHQYWAHQVIGANMKGSTMLSESFAEYSSLMVMKQETGLIQMKDFLKYDLQRYLRGRSQETEKEQPLMKVENQAHIHYGKGSVILYALQEYIGEDKVNMALRDFLEEYRYQPPPYPTAYDFMRHLEPQVPDSLSYLITDWFEEITLYDLRMESAAAQKVGSQYKVKLQIRAKKLKSTPEGESREAPINDWVDIGFYADSDDKELIQRERIRLKEELTEYTVKLDELPRRAAVDPLRLLIDRVYDDNVKSVEVE